MFLALDFGGTKLSVGVWRTGDASWSVHKRVYSPREADAEYEIQLMSAMALEALQGAQPAAVGVSFGGPVNFDTGTVRLSHHVSGWEETSLSDILSQRFGAPVLVDNDANAGALGEYHFGAGRGCSSLLYVTVSTGVGSGWILNGAPWRGLDRMAGEIGHTVVDPNGPPCLCGKRGCLERFASGPYMASQARELLLSTPEKGAILRSLARDDLQAITGKMLAEAAADGDRLAEEVLEHGAWAVGVGIGNAANLMNPERIVLGGGVTQAGDYWWKTVRRVARQIALPEVSLEIVPAALGADAPLWGALSLARSLIDSGCRSA